jgi:putative oxidoreductase
MAAFKKMRDKYGEYLYSVFRILVGLLFFLHGFDKIFTKGVELTSLIGLAGIIELLVGLGVLLGFYTRLAALGGALLMLVAYFKAHAGGGLSPLANGGEAAVLYFAVFLVLLVFGARKWGLEMSVLGKEKF